MSKNKTHDFWIRSSMGKGIWGVCDVYTAQDPYTGHVTVLFPDNVVHAILPSGERRTLGAAWPENGGQQCTQCKKFRDDVLFYDEQENRTRETCDHCRKR